MHKSPPGMKLREAHGHLGMLGDALRQPDLAKCQSLAECLELIRSAASGAAAKSWVLIRGARIESWHERRWPTISELDTASGGVPVVVMSFDHHMAVANTSALTAANLRPGLPVPPNGIVCADNTGQATGLLMEQAAVAAWNAAPPVSSVEQVERIRLAAQHLAAFGFVEVHDLHTPPGMGRALAELVRRGELPLRVWLYPPFERIEREAAEAAEYESAQVKLAGGKLFADGTLNSRTALVLDPYADVDLRSPWSRGRAMHTPEQIDQAIVRCDAVGKHIAVHAIGDGAVRMVLDCFERVRPRSPGGRIEHCELIDDADIPRFKRLGVACSVQPCHLLADIEVLRRALPHAERKVLPLRDLLATGLEPGNVTRGLVFGSDVPIVRADPGDSIQAAVERRRPEMPVSEALNPGQAIETGVAWACFGGV